MNLALFDFDGTLTLGDNFVPFARMQASRRRKLVADVCLSPLVVGYELGYLRPSWMRQRISWFAFRGRPLSEVAQWGEHYAAQVLPRNLRSEAFARLQWHQAQGDTIAVVSASLEPYLAPWCRQHGLELICTRLEVRAGVCTGRYLHGDCTGAEKARRIRERFELQRYAQVYAYGDTPEDSEMLALAHRPHLRGREIASSLVP
jgi:HAD superfamily hydrolase (TIGR01490 family)